MKEIVVFQFSFFYESLKQEAVSIIWDFEGIDEVLTDQEAGQIMVEGEFDKFEMTSELKKLDESVNIIDVIPLEQEAEPQVNKPVKATTSKYPSSWFGGAGPSKPPVRKFGQANQVNQFGQPNKINKFRQQQQIGGGFLDGDDFGPPWLQPNQVNQFGQPNQNQNGKKVEKPYQSPWKPKNPSDHYARLVRYPDGPEGKGVEVKKKPFSFSQFKREEYKAKQYKKQHPSKFNEHDYKPNPYNEHDYKPNPYAQFNKLGRDKHMASSIMGTPSSNQFSSSMGTPSSRQFSSSMGTPSFSQSNSSIGTSSTRQASTSTQRQSRASTSTRDQHSTQTQQKDSRSDSKKEKNKK